MKGPAHLRGGFTLLELLVALALTGGLFIALIQFVFSMEELWGKGEQRRYFERHASAVAHHLQDMVTMASSRLSTSSPIAISDQLSIGGDQELVTLELPEGDRVLVWPGQPLPNVVCGLQIRAGEGLMLRWISRQESGYQNRSPCTSILSPFGHRLEYEYHDKIANSWRTYDSPQRDAQGEWMLPTRLRIHFSREKHETVRTVLIPPRQVALPVF
jgi:prepilin-type N-terminal cleavage/methylation domain-containing protein